jgi:Predicted transcriptional regulator
LAVIVIYCICIFLPEREVTKMAVSYKKLWHLLLDRDMKKKDLEALAGVNHYTMRKLSRNENVTTDIIGRICVALDCKVEDIMDFIQENNE